MPVCPKCLIIISERRPGHRLTDQILLLDELLKNDALTLEQRIQLTLQRGELQGIKTKAYRKTHNKSKRNKKKSHLPVNRKHMDTNAPSSPQDAEALKRLLGRGQEKDESNS